ncbi:MAG: isoprenylcysteine carboxylmethyltransferase family protein [Candidatus Bathyarchaeota archaeon]|nr:isoprenylcysteine carboxylmethyltransferase family protein [Candidatus Bathyarchaeota archaeon]
MYEKVEKPSDFSVSLAAVGTFTYFIEVFAYMFLTFTGQIFVLNNILFKFSSNFYMQILGVILTLVGYFLFIWSVIVRDKYAVSWEMPENHKLITWGPYCYVRHPSYVGYFLMFFGLFFLWPNVFTIFPLMAIPGYVQVTYTEEKLLVQRFVGEYLEYQKKTGRFIPKLHKKEKETPS